MSRFSPMICALVLLFSSCFSSFLSAQGANCNGCFNLTDVDCSTFIAPTYPFCTATSIVSDGEGGFKCDPWDEMQDDDVPVPVLADPSVGKDCTRLITDPMNPKREVVCMKRHKCVVVENIILGQLVLSCLPDPLGTLLPAPPAAVVAGHELNDRACGAGGGWDGTGGPGGTETGM